MPLTARRLLTGPLLVLAIGAGLAVSPSPAAAAAVGATVKVGSTLKVRATSSLSSKIVGTVKNMQRVSMQCVTPGTKVRGKVRTSNLWAKIGTGRYVSFAYLKADRPIVRCSVAKAAPAKAKSTAKPAAKKPAYIVGTISSKDGPVAMRTGAKTSAKAVLKLADKTRVALVCRVTGQNVAGTVRTSKTWGRTGSRNYVSYAYMVAPTLPPCNAAPAPAAALTPEQFIKAAVPGAQQGWREYGVPPSVTIAQAILESGWGKSDLSTKHRNYFGIKCQNGKYGTLANGCATYRTTECTKAGSCFSTSAVFRTYSSMANSFRDHGNFLKVNSRYKPAFKYTKSANNFIHQVWKAGYATDPNYYTKITGIMAKHGLYKYDTWK